MGYSRVLGAFSPGNDIQRASAGRDASHCIFSYTLDYGDPDAADWQSAKVNVAAARTYAVSSQASLAFASVGNAHFITSGGLDINVVNAWESFDKTPLAYASFNTTGLADTVPYTTNGEQSWGILQQVNAGFPSYIPKVMGDIVTRHTVKISNLLRPNNS